MKKVILINGSQKPRGSNSGVILETLDKLLNGHCEVKSYRLRTGLFPRETLEEMALGDVIVLIFPLYFHSVPSNMLKMLTELERILKDKQTDGILVYAIINNGLFEGKQTHIAFDIIRHWCDRSGTTYGGGIGQGAGEMLGVMSLMPLSFGPFNNLARAMKALSIKIKSKEPFETVYLNPYFPRFLWSFIGVHFSWYPKARKNGLSKKDIISAPIDQSDKA